MLTAIYTNDWANTGCSMILFNSLTMIYNNYVYKYDSMILQYTDFNKTKNVVQ